VRPAVQQLGLEGLRFHDLRHTAATLAAAAGATTRELMERMGHTSPAVALRYQLGVDLVPEPEGKEEVQQGRFWLIRQLAA
jgi:integrase